MDKLSYKKIYQEYIDKKIGVTRDASYTTGVVNANQDAYKDFLEDIRLIKVEDRNRKINNILDE